MPRNGYDNGVGGSRVRDRRTAGHGAAPPHAHHHHHNGRAGGAAAAHAPRPSTGSNAPVTVVKKTTTSTTRRRKQDEYGDPVFEEVQRRTEVVERREESGVAAAPESMAVVPYHTPYNGQRRSGGGGGGVAGPQRVRAGYAPPEAPRLAPERVDRRAPAPVKAAGRAAVPLSRPVHRDPVSAARVAPTPQGMRGNGGARRAPQPSQSASGRLTPTAAAAAAAASRSLNGRSSTVLSPAPRATPPAPVYYSYNDGGDDEATTPLTDHFGDDTPMDDYETPARRSGGRYSYGQPSHETMLSTRSAVAGAMRGEVAHFRVRVDRCTGVFAEMQEAGRVAPTTFLALHTAEGRAHSGVVANSFDPVFNDEFLFTSSRPEDDALVCTLVAVPTNPNASEKKVAECVLSLRHLAWREEREVWVPMVRHPGTANAYEQGELLVKIFSEDFGVDELPPEEEEEVFAEEMHSVLTTHAPEQLHRLDWLIGEYLPRGPDALKKLRTRYAVKSVDPVTVWLTLKEVSGLVDAEGRPAQVETCYVVLSGGGKEEQTKTVPYRRRAVVNQEFKFGLRNPEADAVSVTVYSAGRRMGEVLVGLTNVQAGKPKEVKLMLVRAAETGDACNGGQVTVTLRTDDYSSPYQMSLQQEEQLRQRVQAYLWCYLRDDLHRLDSIVAGIDDADAYMREWSRTIGPEPSPKHLVISVRSCKNALRRPGTTQSRCYVRVSAGPTVARTEVARLFPSGDASFNSTVPLTVYDEKRDSVELVLVMEAEACDRELSRVVVGVNTLPKGQTILRELHLVAEAHTNSACLQGSLMVELLAKDFGVSGLLPAPANGQTAEETNEYYTSRLEALIQRSAPDALHRVPYMIDTAPPGQLEKLLAEKSKEYGAEVAAAPMTVRITALKDFLPSCDCYVKVYLNNEPILRTHNKAGGAAIKFDIGDDNESTVRLTNASQSVLSFKIGQHRSLRRTLVIARADLSLRSMIRGELNTLWVPFFANTATKTAKPKESKPRGGKGDKISGNRMPGAPSGAATAMTTNSVSGTNQLGLLGVELQSMAFPNTTVMLYKAHTGEKISAYDAVTRDVTSLVAKYRPQDLPKVQPLIAQCSSLKEAHSELRAQICPKPATATVFVHIDKVEMNAPDGRTQEQQCGIMVDALYQDEHQQSKKKREFENDVIHQRDIYPVIRLDLTKPVKEAGPLNTKKPQGSPLELRLIGVRGVGRALPSSSAPIGGAAAAGGGGGTTGGQTPNRSGVQVTGASMTAPANPLLDPHPTTLGGKNNLNSYIKDRSLVTYDEGAAAAARRSRSFPAATGSSSAASPVAVNAAYLGELGLVRLSLRALLSSPLHKLGDRVTVPIIKPLGPAPFGATGKPGGAASNPRNIVGHVTFHLTCPAFEVTPEWLKLAGRDVMSKVSPDYVHYYERRIGAYLREYDLADLADFHYNLYERDVATGLWPIALYDWLAALKKRFGPETAHFGPEPPLPFDPEAVEVARLMDKDHLREREAAFSDSDVAPDDEPPQRQIAARPDSAVLVGTELPTPDVSHISGREEAPSTTGRGNGRASPAAVSRGSEKQPATYSF